MSGKNQCQKEYEKSIPILSITFEKQTKNEDNLMSMEKLNNNDND